MAKTGGPAKALTARAIETTKAPKDGKTKFVADGLVPGLGIRYGARGRPSFTLAYRIGGKQKRVSLGLAWTGGGDPAPGWITLAAARAEATRIKEAAARGTEAPPPSVAPTASAAAPALTVDGAIQRYAREHLSRLRSGREVERTLRLELPANRPVSSITRADIRTILDRIIARGADVMANRTRSHLSGFFTWLAEHDIVDANPVTMRKPAREVARDRVLTDSELRTVWQRSAALSLPQQACIRTLLLTGQRRGETARMEWSEIDLEGERVWRIPGSKTKNGRSHTVHLAPLAIEAIRSAPRLENARFVFSFNGEHPIDVGELTTSFRRLGVQGARLHDLRRTFATGLQRLGVAYEVRELCLNHVDGSVAAVYGRHDYLNERRAAMVKWAEHVEKIIAV